MDSCSVQPFGKRFRNGLQPKFLSVEWQTKNCVLDLHPFSPDRSLTRRAKAQSNLKVCMCDPSGSFSTIEATIFIPQESLQASARFVDRLPERVLPNA